MGNEADAARDAYEIDDADRACRYAARPVPTAEIWVTRDGRRVRVRDMAVSHVANTVHMLRRKARRILFARSLKCFLTAVRCSSSDAAAEALADEQMTLGETTSDELLLTCHPTFPALLRRYRSETFDERYMR